MGFIKFSELAHALEDVLSMIRDNEITVKAELMDYIFEGCDILENGLEEISNGNSENIEDDSLLENLKKYNKEEEEEDAIKFSIEEKIQLSKEEWNVIDESRNQNLHIFRIIIVFDRKNLLKNAKALVILRNLSGAAEVIKTTPTNDQITSGKFESEIEIVLSTAKTKDEIEKLVNRISGLKNVFVMGIDELYKKTDEIRSEEKELAKAAITDLHKADVVKQIQSIKVEMESLDKLMNLVGELLINNIRLQDIDRKQDFHSMRQVVEGIDRLTLDLQDEVMTIRMVPIGNIFRRFPRMVRDLAKNENKNIDLMVDGQEIKFDRTVLDEIGDPLVHLLRNCVDHGIESEEERTKQNKPVNGNIRLIARREKNSAVIEVTDDGAGIDPQKVKESCIRKGILTKEDADKMNDLEMQMMIFKAGVSTTKVVTEVSGRGVGMDVVMTKIRDLGGKVRLESVVGKGTTVIMQLPLTLAIITVFLVKVREETYAIPLTSVHQTVKVDYEHLKTIQGNKVFILRGEDIPIYWLHDLTNNPIPENNKKLTVVVVYKDNELVGIVVDTIISQQQILIKSMQDLVKGTKGVSGATILGDGSVALILDIGTLL
jgi:two-component system chemotaxis sensor kinase CheA